MQTFRPRISLLKQPSGVSPGLSLQYDKNRRLNITFPPDTKAFLYYFTPPEKPPIAGELRLRVASSNDLASFKSGADLMRTDDQPWSRPLLSLFQHYFPLYEKLREERLVPDDLDKTLSTFPSYPIRYRRCHIIYSLNDTFIIDFHQSQLSLSVITEQGVVRLPFRDQFYDCRIRWKGVGIYTGPFLTTFSRYSYIDYSREFVGSALARFERSTLPDHIGTRTVVLRFLKIITPVKCIIPLYDGYISCPREGELYRRYISPVQERTVPPVWSVNIDGPKDIRIQGLRLLWNATPTGP